MKFNSRITFLCRLAVADQAHPSCTRLQVCHTQEWHGIGVGGRGLTVEVHIFACDITIRTFSNGLYVTQMSKQTEKKEIC